MAMRKAQMKTKKGNISDGGEGEGNLVRES